MNVPLIQKPETNDINASLIAIRKQLQILNESVNNIENKYLLKSELKELSAETVGGDGKYIESVSESNGVINAVEKSLGNMVPVDTVTSGNTHSVTSNAVAEAIGTQEIVYQTNGLTVIGIKCQNGTYLNFHFSGFMSNTNIDYLNTILATLPQNYRPLEIVRIIVHMATTGDRIVLGVDININGELTCYPLSKDIMTGSVTCNGIYGDAFCRIQ